MTNVLEEMIQEGEKTELTIIHRTQKEVEEAYHFDISPPKMQYYAKKFFRKEHDGCEKLRKILESMNEPATYIYVRTDSSAVKNYKAVYNHIKEWTRKAGFEECDIEIPLIEAYQNAVIHQGGGEESDYDSRKGAKRPTDWEERREQPIELELMISKEFYLMRVTDCGKGFDVPNIQPGMNGDIMAFEGRGLKMISGLTDCMIGSRQEYPQRFAFTIIKYKDSPKNSECIVKL